MPEETVTNNSNLWIGEILRAARLRAGLTQEQIGIATGCKSRDRIVRMWENDKKGLGGHSTKLSKVLDAYQVTEVERQEIIKRISLRKQEFVAKKLGAQTGTSPYSIVNSVPEELAVLNQLMSLTPEKRQWVIKTSQSMHPK